MSVTQGQSTTSGRRWNAPSVSMKSCNWQLWTRCWNWWTMQHSDQTLTRSTSLKGSAAPLTRSKLCTMNSVKRDGTISLPTGTYITFVAQHGFHIPLYSFFRLNQDKLERKFAVYRASGGNNNHPRAADFCHRFRYSAVFSNTDGILSKCTSVEDTGCEDEPTVSANLSGSVFSVLCICAM